MSTPYRPCPQCGMPQAPNQAFCSNCGTRLSTGASSPAIAPPELASPPPGIPPTELASSPPSGAGDVHQLPFPASAPYKQPPVAQNASTQYGGAAYGDRGQYFAPAPPPQMGYAPQNPYAPVQGSGFHGQHTIGNNFAPYPQGPQPKKPINPLFLILGVLLLLVLAGGSFFVYEVTKLAGKTHTPSTPAAQLSSPTAVPTQAPLFTDNFADNSKNWDTRSAAGFGITIGNNLLTMKEANHRIFQEPVPTTVPNDFTVSTTFTLVQGDSNDSVGLQLRTGANNSQGYVVEVYGDDTYDIVKVAPDPNDNNKLKFSTLVAPTASTFIKTKGTPNTMTVTMKGVNLVVQFNGKIVKMLTDSSFTGGSLNLFLVNGDTSNGTTATFTNLTVYPAPARLP